MAAALIAATILPYSTSVMAPTFTPRLVFFCPLAGLFIAHSLWTGARSSRAGLRADALDLAVVAFAAWVVVSALLAPAPAVAWLGSYNRGTGALFWLVCSALFLVARRVLAREDALDSMAAGVAVVLIVEALLVGAQAAGLGTPWDTAFVEQGRMSGTLGNPVMLAGASLSAVWLAARVLLAPAPLGARDVLVATGAAAGALVIVSTVSRAGYLALAFAAALLIAVLASRRSWRRVVVVAAAAVVIGVSTVAYSPPSDTGAGAAGALASRVVDEGAFSPSDQGRLEFWKAGVLALEERPLLGYGAGAYATAYRRHISGERLRLLPNTVVSDPHDLPVLVGSTTGVPGLILASLVVGLAAVSWWRSRAREGGLTSDGWAAPVFACAIGVFLLVSPLDLAVAVPGAVILGALSGFPGVRLVEVRRPGFERASRFVLLTSAAVVLLAAVASTWQVAALWRADAALLDYGGSGDTSVARVAADRASRWPYYSLVAGFGTWREGLEQQDKDLVNEGERYLRAGLGSDPYLVEARLELARLYLSTTREAKAADELRAALAVNPHHPLAQGLLAYLAYMAATGEDGTSDRAAADALLGELERLPVDSADGWYWIARTREALGDAAGAGAAEERAHEIDPTLSEKEYRDRVSGG